MPSKKLIRKLDKVFSAYIRNKGKCEWCGKGKWRGQMQCCHIFSRRYHNTRWDELNCLCLCAGCHMKGHLEPIEFVEFVKEHLGKKVYEELRLKHNEVKKWKDWELEEMIIKFKER